jgi:DNA helicase II / ATP-dependent DNA helicase PcrA
VPARGLSDGTMERLLGASAEHKCSVFAAMKNPAVRTTFQARTRESIEAFVELVERTRDRLHDERLATQPRPLQLWVDPFLHQIRYLEDLRRSEKDAESGESRVRNLKELMSSLDDASTAAQRNATTLTDRLQAFLEDITLDTEREEEEDEAPGDAVTLITMHSCKGLEFPHVYIVGVEEGLLPHARSKTEGTLDEERRLFYVAVTRAMQTLTISHCSSRKKYGQLAPCHPSQFLGELPAELVEHAALRKQERASKEVAQDWFAQMRAAAG